MHSTASTPCSRSSDPMQAQLQADWLAARERLAAKGLLQADAAALSLRVPGSDRIWHGDARDDAPRLIDGPQAGGVAATVFAARPDVCAVVCGGGRFGGLLHAFGGCLPAVFDEQVRHLGRMPAAQSLRPGWHAALAGGANVLLLDGLPLVLGTTATRGVLNAELFEKCAKAGVLAIAAGGAIEPLPWIVRHVANSRLLKDEARARARVAQGRLPEESRGY